MIYNYKNIKNIYMKVYIIGHKGWIGKMYQEELKKQLNSVLANIEMKVTKYTRYFRKQATHVFFVVWVELTVLIKKKQFTTIDYLRK